MEKLAKMKKDAEEQAAFQQQILAPLPPVASRIDGIPITCYEYNHGKRNSNDSDDAYKAQGLTKGRPENAAKYSSHKPYVHADKAKARRASTSEIIRGKYTNAAAADVCRAADACRAKGMTRGRLEEHKRNDFDEFRAKGMTKARFEQHKCNDFDEFRTKGMTKGGPSEYSARCSDKDKDNDHDEYRAKGVTKGGPAVTTTCKDKGTNNNTSDKYIDLFWMANSKSGNQTVDLYLQDAYCNKLVKKMDANVDEFLDLYMVPMVQADSVYSWACEQIRSQVLTPATLIEQLRDVFDDDNQATATAEKKEAASWGDVKKYADKMKDIYWQIAGNSSGSWRLFSNAQLIWFYFRCWFMNSRLSGCIIERARLALQRYPFSKHAQKMDIVQTYDKMYERYEMDRAIKALQKIQDEEEIAAVRRKHGYPAGDEMKHNDEDKRLKNKLQTRIRPGDRYEVTITATTAHSGTYSSTSKDLQKDDGSYKTRKTAKRRPRCSPRETRQSTTTYKAKNHDAADTYRATTITGGAPSHTTIYKGINTVHSAETYQYSSSDDDDDDDDNTHTAKGTTTKAQTKTGRYLSTAEDIDDDDAKLHVILGESSSADKETHSTKNKAITADFNQRNDELQHDKRHEKTKQPAAGHGDNKEFVPKAKAETFDVQSIYDDYEYSEERTDDDNEDLSTVDMDICSEATSFIKL